MKTGAHPSREKGHESSTSHMIEMALAVGSLMCACSQVYTTVWSTSLRVVQTLLGGVSPLGKPKTTHVALKIATWPPSVVKCQGDILPTPPLPAAVEN